MIAITIDGQVYEAEEGKTVLQAARANNISIPTLCYHPALQPSGSCKLCAVEVTGRSGRQIAMLSCILKVKDGMEIKTTGPVVEAARTKAFQNLLRMAPQSKRLRQMAREHGVDLGTPPDGCVRCRLCVRVCKEVVGAGALKMKPINGVTFVVPEPDRCIGCGTCANICPTGAIRVKDHENVRSVMIRDEVVGKHPLERCEGCGRWFATTRFMDFIEQRTAPHPHVKETHAYCPTCAKMFSDRTRAVSEHSVKLRMPGH
ncbi:2Fe-2S iron-sulfur cluster-binding protein [uncultured Desulfosarcina sp.]|uniref:2Fe-2S iron-sulfur cluster-binding protein n=1 Tax=uncultured Desulfosarcina sp. TaxID=218289 RepID=UPI0029C85F4F|nr:2Fe-2S iron-sulfur cluster-binding protein [uncultured Desulfosarcina sp.]